MGLLRVINEYFRDEFKTFLDDEIRRNKHVKLAPEAAETVTTDIVIDSIESSCVTDSLNNKTFEEDNNMINKEATDNNDQDNQKTHIEIKPRIWNNNHEINYWINKQHTTNDHDKSNLYCGKMNSINTDEAANICDTD
ncbi:unnamed protein product [Diamesa serratosioi]